VWETIDRPALGEFVRAQYTGLHTHPSRVNEVVALLQGQADDAQLRAQAEGAKAQREQVRTQAEMQRVQLQSQSDLAEAQLRLQGELADVQAAQAARGVTGP